MVRVAHISDSHLGCSQFQLVERREDARKCLQKAVNMAMRHSPDILVHTGDLFDNPYPSWDDANFTLELFRKLQDRVYTIVLQGNHDLPYGYRRTQSPVLALQNAGFITSTGAETHQSIQDTFDGQTIDMHLISWTRPRELQGIVDYIPASDNITMLFAHNIPSPRDQIPAHFDYIGIGHKHNFWLDEDLGIGRPGSTCVVDWRREQGGKKKLIVTDVSSTGNEYITETLNDVREFKFITGINITGMGPIEAEETMRNRLNSLSPKKSKPIIIMEVAGTIDSETENEINRVEILKYGEERLKPLFFHIEPKWSSLGPRAIKLREPLNVEKSIEDYITQTGEGDLTEILGSLERFTESKVS
ncbi:MAG: exonuclease SbcCD subunit D [Candidatus Thorarchaeota archaeon]